MTELTEHERMVFAEREKYLSENIALRKENKRLAAELEHQTSRAKKLSLASEGLDRTISEERGEAALKALAGKFYQEEAV